MTATNDSSHEDFIAAFSRGQRKRSMVVSAVTGLTVLAAASALAIILSRVAAAQADVGEAHRELTTVRDEQAKASAELTEVRRNLAETKLNRDSLVDDIAKKNQQLESLNADLDKKRRDLDEVQRLAERLPQNQETTRIKAEVQAISVRQASFRPPPSSPSTPPIEKVATVRMSLAPFAEKFMDRPVYNVRIWIDLPKARVPEVLKAEYFFNHASFVPKLQASFDANNQFALSYRGYGCVDATATLVLRDGSRHPLPFNMCQLWSGVKPR